MQQLNRMDCRDPNGSRNDGTPVSKSTNLASLRGVNVWTGIETYQNAAIARGKCILLVLRLLKGLSLRGNGQDSTKQS